LLLMDEALPELREKKNERNLRIVASMASGDL
jgi:hypothetical protein